jgi:CheY-like chemotaxis protein
MVDRKRILLVEDDEITIAFTRRMLVDAGYRVDAAMGSGSAIKLLTSNNYDLVVLDISMPTLSGFDILQLMESFQIESKVVFLTNLSDEKTLSKVKKIKINRFISKEKELKILPSIVREVLIG